MFESAPERGPCEQLDCVGGLDCVIGAPESFKCEGDSGCVCGAPGSLKDDGGPGCVPCAPFGDLDQTSGDFEEAV